MFQTFAAGPAEQIAAASADHREQVLLVIIAILSVYVIIVSCRLVLLSFKS